MKYSFKKINIEAPFPTTQCGHSCQTFLVEEFRDHLFARVAAFKTENNWIIHLSIDVLAYDSAHRLSLQQQLREYYHDDSIHLITSATHTHYANSVRDEKYVEYLSSLLFDEICTMSYEEMDNVTVSFQHRHTYATGKSRISGYETDNETLGLVRFYSNDDNFLNIIYNNCHPTCLGAETTHFFSAEYPGVTLKKMEDRYPDADFTFMQGAAGDISSRFVREGQDYDSMCKLADNLCADLQTLFDSEAERKPFEIEYREISMPVEHEFTPIDLSNIRADLSERELQTIQIGQIEREKLQKKANEIFGTLATEFQIVSVDISAVKFIFFPNEIFSEYINYIDKDRELLVSYSNGYGPYVLPIDFQYITYEMFTDTTTRDTKLRIAETIRTI